MRKYHIGAASIIIGSVFMNTGSLVTLQKLIIKLLK
ncbi:YSIRK-type signal peptide-containing protein [Staphylococcus xylosus]|uniref:YSIRK-type signal peptide-containing protein n=1 Tax=Staphylococcus xylosus TaxID=1288 RepID=A0A939NDU8_STAXY|nr:YSIRK-type signal peptide-containing protein [Staphylococcus xylosus]